MLFKMENHLKLIEIEILSQKYSFNKTNDITLV